MSADLTRRAFAGGALALGLGRGAFAQGFAGLGESADGFAAVTPGRQLVFPDDHGPHPAFRIEWWYVTANLSDADGAAYGAQWTLFRQAMTPGPPIEGWANQQVWMGHAAVTSATTHRFDETLARGGVGQAGVELVPFQAWIDAWELRATDGFDAATVAPLDLKASAAGFSYALRLAADRPLVLQGDHGYSRKSDRGQASYYYSQPFFTASGTITIDGKPVTVTGHAWMDREWSSQPLASDQTGWDWFSLHLPGDEKLMLYRLRQQDGRENLLGNWITPDGRSAEIAAGGNSITPSATAAIGGRKLPTSWRVNLPARGLAIETTPLNPHSWMGTSVPYWEGPISFAGSHAGVGYLEMTGY
ncbi:iron ABC transporter permease [Bradyrhizobium jicamae]|uniref:Iron ABC transporter permease n=1 Tax=Bradyrhizobium jicamae TaxID=280332 RepID=A0ABS5FBY9_9BRAD|nr:lipocalin-like domain-containing protein [Bradyrhizobium jicamae]MBR0794305.1 iron ABC transporter permease [Bradyrhizobium jicamae]MBR0933456.1 iron ABC transporter permease [Bradyrhizobium jicamae]